MCVCVREMHSNDVDQDVNVAAVKGLGTELGIFLIRFATGYFVRFSLD